jgi:hypothetical protein
MFAIENVMLFLYQPKTRALQESSCSEASQTTVTLRTPLIIDGRTLHGGEDVCSVLPRYFRRERGLLHSPSHHQ